MANYKAKAFRRHGIYAWVHIDDLIAAQDDKEFFRLFSYVDN